MAEHDKDSRLDALLDEQLSAYSAVNPRPGFETRMRARLRAQVAQSRRKSWILPLACSVATILLVVWLAQLGTSRRDARPSIVRQTTPPTMAPITPQSPTRTGSAGDEVYGRKARSLARRPGNVSASALSSFSAAPFAASNTAKVRYKALLQMASMVHTGQDVSFAQEKLYTQPAPQAEVNSEAGQQTVAPEISIQDLGVRSIEIKEIAPEKDDEKEDYER